jgi:hypothetical protein
MMVAVLCPRVVSTDVNDRICKMFLLRVRGKRDFSPVFLLRHDVLGLRLYRQERENARMPHRDAALCVPFFLVEDGGQQVIRRVIMPGVKRLLGEGYQPPKQGARAMGFCTTPTRPRPSTFNIPNRSGACTGSPWRTYLCFAARQHSPGHEITIASIRNRYYTPPQ